MKRSTVIIAFCGWSLLVVPSAVVGLRDFYLGRPRRGFMSPIHDQIEADVDGDSLADVQELYYTQTLDHFNGGDGRTFQQRYFLNDKHYAAGGPVFVQIGGEGPISKGFSAGGDWVKNGIKYRAIMFQLEHRFYGETQPMKDLSVASLQYLSSEQALMDLAQFITAMKTKYKIPQAKVIVFGGSYAGAMATWFRSKYPHIADGAVGSSGPVFAKVDFSEYMETVGNSAQYNYPGCRDNIQNAFTQLNTMISDANQIPGVIQKFNICSGFTTADPFHLQNFFANIIGPFQGNVQYNGQGPYSITKMCKMLADTSTPNLVDRLAKLSVAYAGGACIDYNYQNDIKFLSQTSLSSPANGIRQWLWQTCTQFGYYQTTDSHKQPFGQTVSLTFEYLTNCNPIFNTNPAKINVAVNQTNHMFGGKNIQGTWITMPNGDMDPWHRLSCTQTPNPSSPAILIHGGSHCQNMGSSKPTDSGYMIRAREQISMQIQLMLLK